MLVADRLSKTYGGPDYAVQDVSFRLERGEVVGFLGPNGAGKTTTLRMLTGFLAPTSGTVTVAGRDVAKEPLRARAAIGYMPESVPLYPEMRVREYLAFRAELKGIARRARRAAVDRALELSGSAGAGEKLIGHLSKGYRQRVGLADALVAAPPILILDEPTSGLDPNQIRDVRRLVRELGRDHAVLFSTHILPEVEAACDRAIVVARGRLVASGTIDELRTMRRPSGVRIVVASDRLDAAVKTLSRLGMPATCSVESGAILVRWTAGVTEDACTRAIEQAARALVESGIDLRELAPVRASLEEVFASLTRAPESSAAEGRAPESGAAEPDARRPDDADEQGAD